MSLLALASAGSAATPPVSAPAPLTAKELAQGFSDRVVLAKPRAQHRATADAAEARERVRVRRTFARFGDVRVIELEGSETVAAAVARLQATGRYEFVEPSYIQKANAIPNDPAFGPLQWHLNNTGQNLGGGAGTPGADIKAPAAWDVINDASGVIVAIVDSGARLTHPEIAPNLWRNPAPTFGDVHGARFTSGTGVPTNGDPTDDDGHGTRMAGFIGGAGNNNNLMTGVAWKVQMMILKQGFDAAGNFVVADTLACFDYAIRHGASIINCSFGNTTYSQAFFTGLKAARDAGVIVVCAAGNDGVNSDALPFYPAGYALDNIVTVGMTDNHDAVSPRSNFGANVDLFAPGAGIVALNWTNDTGAVVVTGTSPTAAFVSGSLALLKARFPGDTYRQLINRLLRGTDRKPAFLGKVQTGGRLNLFNAVTSTSHRPMNDDFADRAIVSGNIATLRSNNAGATTETGESTHAGVPAAATLWWEWTAPQTAPVTIDTAGSDYDTVLAVYTGPVLGALAATAASDDAPGRTTSRVTFTAQAGATYHFAVGSKGATTGLTLVNLTASPGTPGENARLANLSVLTTVPAAGDSFTIGYVLGGSGTSGAKRILIRAAGPTLGAEPFNIPGVLADPRIEYFAGSTRAGANDNWGGTAALRAAFAAVGAFPFLSATSRDAAVLATVGAGSNSVLVAGTGNGTGTVIAELYDSTSLTAMTSATPRLVNVSVLKHLGTGLTTGFVVDGTGSKRLLIRAVGPTLGAAPFSVPGAVSDPQLTLYFGQASVGVNDNWGGAAELAAVFNQVGAFPLPADSRDAALLVTLGPGSYSVEVSGVGGATGVALVEIYEVP